MNNAPIIPAWVSENYPNAFSTPILGGRTTPLDASLLLFRESPRALYLLDGPTFPVGDGGSWLKSKVLAALAGIADGAMAIAPQLGVDDESQYKRIGLPVIWIDPRHYYGDALREIIILSQVRWIFTDSLETSTRIPASHTKMRRAILMLDDYACTRRRERIGQSNQLFKHMLEKVLGHSELSIWRSRQDAVPYAAHADRSLIIDGIEHNDRVKLSAEGHVAMLANFQYPPNRDAVKYLLRLDWGARRLKLIGRIDRNLRHEAELMGHRCTGLVADPREELRGCIVGIDPVMQGSGLSTKLASYIAVGLPALATQVAVRGMDPELVRLITVVGEPAEIPALINALNYPYICSKARLARRYARQNLNISEQLEQLPELIS